MNGATHIIGGVTAAVLLGETTPAALTVVVTSSLMSDIDRKNSLLGRFIPVLPHFLEGVVGKRTITHSLLFGVVIAGLLNLVSQSLVIPFVIGYGSHLLLDVITGRIVLLWPLPWKLGIPLFGISPVFVESFCIAVWGAWIALGGYQHYMIF